MTEASKRFVKLSIWSTVLFFILRCMIGWNELSQIVNTEEYIKLVYMVISYAGEAIAVSTLFMWAFNTWWWRCKPLIYIAGGMPVLAKKYKGTITFEYEGQTQTIVSEMYIIQTFLDVSVKIDTNESTSNSITAKIVEENGSKTLIYTYLNTPRAELQDRSAIHYGTAMLCIDNPKHIKGNYFTIRQSRGSMDFGAVEEKKRRNHEQHSMYRLEYL